MRARKFKNRVFHFFVYSFTTLTFLPLLFFMIVLFYKGISNLSPWKLLTEMPPVASNNVSKIGEGGILSAIVGSILISLVSLIIAAPLGAMLGIYIGDNPNKRLSRFTELASDVLQGVPSIVIGIFAYLWFVAPFKSFSGLSASFALSLMMLPFIITSSSEVVRSIPKDLREATYAMGARHFHVVRYLIFPLAFPTILNAVIISTTRIAGETAPLLFTAFGNLHKLEWNITREMHAVPLLIFEFSQSPFPNLKQLAWNASLFLIIFLFFVNFLTKILYNKYKIKW